MIKVLDSWIADKIAAGEVIERPLSIVKELVENSIDAGSTSIIVEIKNGGKSYIRVTDNGCGIPADEIETAFLRHATSKISSINDLDAIDTLGFRGEALASISAISKLTIVSRTSDSKAGTKLEMHGGQIIAKSVVGANAGTSIIVEDVFYNTPARRKFMHTDAREASAIIEFVQTMAIYYSSIKFMLINNYNTILNTNGDGNFTNVISTVYNSQDYNNLIELNTPTVKGYISDPGTTKSNRKGQLFYVNGRLVDSKLIEDGILKGYGDRVFSGYPIAILFIDANPSTIDVNIHPGKKEIKFLHSDDVLNSISEAIRNAMNKETSIPKAIVPKETYKPEMPPAQYIEEANKQLDIKDYLSSLVREDETIEADSINEPVQALTNNNCNESFEWSELTLAGYVLNSYIICQAKDTVYVIDQHAAHERVFFETLMSNYHSNSHVPQPVLTPFIIETSLDVYNNDRSWMDALSRIGYCIEDFGAGSFVIKGIPEFMNIDEARTYAIAFIDCLGQYDGSSAVIDKIIMNSCKSAVKAGDKLSDAEISSLIESLSKCDNPFSCPHGRPTLIKISKYEIERSFKRK